jgi:hypothetical protein
VGSTEARIKTVVKRKVVWNIETKSLVSRGRETSTEKGRKSQQLPLCCYPLSVMW